jgi:glycosyltransferase involved in cell wall biosynthesis
VYIGRISREKQVHVLRDTVARLPGVRLALVGGGPELATMQRYFADTPAHFVGYLRGDDVAAAYASADVLVFPSLSETFGLAPLEAMACGLPVIATTVGGLVDTVRDGVNALTYDPAAPHQITAQLERLRGDPALRQRLREGALAHARGRDWQATMDQLIGFYQLAQRMHRWRRLARTRRTAAAAR